MGKMYSGNLDVDFQNDTVDIAKHDGSTKGLELGGTLVTATAAEMNARLDAANRVVNVTDAATYTVLAADSGKVHIVPDLTADCVISLPAVAAGLEYQFVYGGVAADVQDFQLDSGSDTNYFLGGLLYVDDAPAADSVAGDGNSNSKVNVLTPEPGTRVHVICDGTNWILSGVVASANAPTFADQ